MSLISAVASELAELAAKLPVEAVKLIVDLVREAVTSEDPTRYIQRRIVSEAAHKATQEGVVAALDRLKEK